MQFVKREDNKIIMHNNEKLFEAVYNEIIFSEYDEKAFENLINFLENEKFILINKVKDKTDNDNYYFEKQGEKLTIVVEENLNAIYLWEEKRYVPLEKFLKKCPRCCTDNIVQKIMYHTVTEENVKRVEEGTLMFMPGAYDRIGVPVPNWKCIKCGFEWHYLEHLKNEIKYKK